MTATTTVAKPESAQLGDVADVQGGLQVSAKRSSKPMDAPYLRVANVQRGWLDLDEIKRIRLNERELDRTRLVTEDLLVVEGHGNKNEIGRVGLWTGEIDPCVHQNHLIRVRCDPTRVHPRYAEAYLNSPIGRRELLGAANTTSGLNTISTGDVKNASIPLPPIEEQRRIAAVLDAADALRAKRREAIAKLDSLTQAIFIDMFGDPRSNCRDLPTQSLQELSDGIYDCPHSTPKWTNEGLICLRTPNLGHGVWDWSDTRYVSLETFENRSKRAELEPGDIVLSREGTVGIAALVQPGMRMCMGQRLVQVRPGGDVRPRFLLSVLLFLLDPARIERVMAGSTAKHLNVKELRLLQVVVPPLKDQDRFVRAAERQSLAATTLLTSERQLDSLFGSLQQRAFRGEL